MKPRTEVLCARCGKRESWGWGQFYKTPRRRRFYICYRCEMKDAQKLQEAIIEGLRAIRPELAAIFDAIRIPRSLF
jgi:hypothetical protein